jgi:hypothetical protein
MEPVQFLVVVTAKNSTEQGARREHGCGGPNRSRA